MEIQHKILNKAEELFLQYGVKSITMDDLAQALGASKKTLYLHVENKADLVFKTVEQHIAQEKEMIARVAESAENAIDEMALLAKNVIDNMSKSHPSMLYDLQKYYPKAWQLFLDFKFQVVYNAIKRNLEKGIQEGLYRPDLNPEIISRIYISRMEVVLDTRLFPRTQYPFIEVYKEQIKYHLRGISSEKGWSYLSSKKLF
jgi:AcrR family transcriptional regulator